MRDDVSLICICRVVLLIDNHDCYRAFLRYIQHLTVTEFLCDFYRETLLTITDNCDSTALKEHLKHVGT